MVIERYGILGVQLDNLEQLYNPLLSGIGSITETRSYLIQKGMNAALAD